MKKSLRLTALALAATLVLSGCIKMEVNLELQSDDTVDGSMVFAVQEGLGELIGEGGDEIPTDEEAADELFGDDLSADFENATEEPYNQDGWVGTRVVFEGEALDDFSEDGEFSIVRDGDNFIVSGPFDTEATEGGDEEMFEGAEMTMSVTFPGEVSDHNGTLEGNTVTWDLLTGPEDLYAVGSATEGGAGIPIWLIIALLVGLLVIGAIIVVVVLVARKGKNKDDEFTAAPPAPVIEPQN